MTSRPEGADAPTSDTSPAADAVPTYLDRLGRPLRDLEPIAVDEDFPSFDGKPPLKLALARL